MDFESVDFIVRGLKFVDFESVDFITAIQLWIMNMRSAVVVLLLLFLSLL